MPNISREDCKACVGKGWSGLIDQIYDILPDDTYIMQVKEKWGGLRFYVGGTTIDVLKAIDKAEDLSYTICEVCGQPGKLRDDLPWMRTLCNEHYKLHKH